MLFCRAVGNADAYADGFGDPQLGKARALNQHLAALRDLFGLCRGGLGQQCSEFVATQPIQAIIGAQSHHQRIGNGDEHPVTRCMAIGVVNGFEAIAIKNQIRDIARVGRQALFEASPVLLIRAPVVAACQYILPRLCVKFAILVFQRAVQFSQLQLVMMQRAAHILQLFHAHRPYDLCIYRHTTGSHPIDLSRQITQGFHQQQVIGQKYPYCGHYLQPKQTRQRERKCALIRRRRERIARVRIEINKRTD